MVVCSFSQYGSPARMPAWRHKRLIIQASGVSLGSQSSSSSQPGRAELVSAASSQGSARTVSSLGLDDNDSVWDPGAGGERDALASLTFPTDAEPRSTTGTTTGT